MLRRVFLSIGWLIAGTLTVHGQAVPAPAAQQAEMMKFQAALMKAHAAAIRPGDEALGCDALQKEAVALTNDPALTAYAAKSNAAAAKQVVLAEKKQAGGAKPAMTPAAAAALAASLSAPAGLPAAGMPAEAQIAQSQQLMTEQMKQAVHAMPALLRSQRLMALAAAKGCTFEQ